MHEKTIAEGAATSDCDEELHDMLIAISVVTKRLAKKITENRRTKEDNRDVQTLWSGRTDHQS